MEIRLSGISKRFNREWIFNGVDLRFVSGHAYAITGPNGSGKSTLLQVISGFQLPSQGQLEWSIDKTVIPAEEYFENLAIASPYMELIGDLTLTEHLEFHFSFKGTRNGLSIRDLLDIGYFNDAAEKPVRHFSSGMKQRLKLLLAFYSDVPVILLDEPTTNMDETGAEWYRSQIKSLEIPVLLIASNQSHEYNFCDSVIDISNYKK